MIKLSLLLFIVTGFINCCFSQSTIKEYIQNNVFPIRTIEPADTEFNDLNNLGKAIGNTRIVMLGEQDHGDAPAFEAKARIIKYLHERLGFDVIAFESDFYSLNKEWDRMEKGFISINDMIDQNVFSIWTKCRQATEIFNYIKACSSTDKKLILTGFDSQVTMPYSQQNFKWEMDKYLKELDIPFVSSSVYKAQFLPYIDSGIYYFIRGIIINEESGFRNFISQIDSLLLQLADKKQETNFWYLSLQSFKTICEMLIETKQNNYPASMETRDKQMAANLAWLVNIKYPSKKIIIWAASYHIIKNKTDKIRHLNMGYYFNEEHQLAKDTYTIGFTSYAGTAGNVFIKPYQFSSSEKESVEEWIHEKKYNYAFIDFRAFRQLNPSFNAPFFMAGVRHLQQEADWTRSFDGVVYIENMYPCISK